MSTKKLFGRRQAVRAVAILGVGGAMALGLAPSASAAPSDGPRASQAVTVTVAQQGNYVAAICVSDILQGTCVEGVRKGQTRTFTVNPPANSPVSVRLIVNGGGSAFSDVVTDGGALRFQSGGSKAKPTLAVR